MRKAIVASAGVVALVVAFGPVLVASSAQKAKVSGPEKVFVLPTDTTTPKHPGKILMTGTIGDYGKTIEVNAKGKPTAHGTYIDVELQKGSILVDVAAFDKAITAAFPHATFDKATCSASVAVHGPITIVSGTKAYAGITGSFAMTGNLAFIGPFKNGACTTKTTTPDVATYFALAGTGTVSIP